MTAPHAGVRMRFLWLRTFHPPVAVRVEHTPDDTRLVAVQLDGRGGHAPGLPARRAELPLNHEEWVSLKGTVERTGFWQLATRDRSLFGVDGAIWLIEIVEPGRRRVVERWGGGALAPLGMRLLALSTLDPEPIY